LLTETVDDWSQQNIADRAGASRKMGSRVFKDLAAGGYITAEHKRIAVNKDLPERW
jgi:CRP-like cAMP-binding protein